MRILWVKAGKLLPVDTGGKIRSYNLLRELAARHEVVLLSHYGGERDEGYEEEIEKHLGRKLTRLPAEAAEPRPPQDRLGHVGVHPQKQPGIFYIGLLAPAARLTCGQMRGLADIADLHGSGDLRLTVWQNLLITDIPADQIEVVRRKRACAVRVAVRPTERVV